MVNKARKGAIRVLLVLWPCLLNCAKEGMPPGGPEDTVPPQVVFVSPSAGSTEVPPDSRIEIAFSERMTTKATEEAIFISPIPSKPFEFKWKGKKLVLLPQESLNPDRTYVISVGADSEDLRRNRLGQTHTFAFSTGSRLDFGTISGEVWIKQAVGLEREMGSSVWAYLLSTDRLEIDPSTQKPDYATQTDNQGGYSLNNLSLGNYRLFAVQDINRDLAWNWEEEPIGLTTQDIKLTGLQISKDGIDFVLDKKDKAGPSLVNCCSVNRNLVKIEFDEELDQRSALDIGKFKILSTSTQKPLNISSVFHQDEDTKRIFLLTEQMNTGEEYEPTVSAVTDRAGNRLDIASSQCRFAASTIPDTLGPSITSILPEDGEANVPLDARVILTFSEPPDHRSVETSFSLADSNGVALSGEGDWMSPNVYSFGPASLLSGATRYQVKLPGEKVRDRLGNVSAIDTVFISGFTTVDPDTLGSVSGTAEVEDTSTPSAAVLTLWHLTDEGISYQLSLPELGPFRFEGVLPGKYFLGGYLDLNGDGHLSLGQPNPFSSAEPLAVYPDTVRVRSRWETEGVKLRLH